MIPCIVDGDLLDQRVDVIVNAWNRNVFPWWLLVPQGVSAVIKRRGGYAPFRELRHVGLIPLGGAVVTGAGRLPFKRIIHVAGINLLWRATPDSIRQSVRSAMRIVESEKFASVAFPVIGAGTGGFGEEGALRFMLQAFSELNSDAKTVIVRFKNCLRG